MNADQRYKRLFQASPTPFLVLAPDAPSFTIAEVNDAYLAATMRTREELIGRPLFEAFPDNPNDLNADGVSNLRTSLERVLDTRKSDAMPTQKYDIARPDGSFEERWWEPVNAAISDEKGLVEALVHHATDVTDRKRAAAALHDSETRLRELNETLEHRVAERTAERDRVWNASLDLLTILDFAGVFEAVNPAWTTVLGYAPDEVLGRQVATFVHPDDVLVTESAMQDAAGGPPPVFENRYRHKDGSYRWFSWVAAPDERVIYATGRDVTVEKAAGLALRAAEDQLRHSQKIEAVGQLTGSVAHDFNNLLTVIRGSLDLLRRPDVPEARRERYLAAISDTTDRAGKLTSQLLAFARRQTLKPVVFDARKSVMNLQDMLRSLSGSGIRIGVTASDEPCLVNSDPSQFDTALVNMAVNARDAMQGGGELLIEVGLVPEMPPIRTLLAVPGEFVAVSLRDTGGGILPEQLDVIFEPFFTTKAVGQGTGLGLSQVFGFAKQSGGEVRVQSVVGEGSTFTLYLPRSVNEEQQADAFDALEGGWRGEGACVLVVEDNADVGAFATQALRELGYQTQLASDARQALAALSESDDGFDVVFSDVVMPGMSGVELGQEIRRLYPSLPVILTSGYSTVLAQNGTYGFELLHKPYSVEELSRALRKAATWREKANKGRDAS